MANMEIVQKMKIPYFQKEALFKLEVKSVLSNFITDIMRPISRVLKMEQKFDEDQKKYNEQINEKFLKDLLRR